MDGELFRRIYHAASEVASRTPPCRSAYSDFDVLVTFIHAACAAEPVSWACRRHNWPIWCWRVNLLEFDFPRLRALPPFPAGEYEPPIRVDPARHEEL